MADIPSAAVFNITYRCQLKCRICNLQSSTLSLKELSTKQIIAILKDLSAAGVSTIDFVGGEVLLKQGITEILKTSRTIFKEVKIVTNGFDGLAFADLLLSLPVDQITVSLDGGYSKTHDSIRGEGVFFRLSGFMRYLKQRKAKGKKPFLTVNTVIVKNNVLELVNILNLASAWGCNNITYEVFLSDNADLRQNQLADPFWVRGDDLKALDSQIQKIIAIKNDRSAPIYVANTMDYLNNIVNYYKNMLEPGIFRCRNGRDFLSVCVDGKVCICDHCLGDLKKDDFLTIWNKSSTDDALRAVASCQRPCMMNCMVGGVEYYGKKE